MFEQIAASLPAALYKEFRLALKRGKWSNGMKLSDKQRKACQQAIFYREFIAKSSIH